jgi:hypothetical protein
VPVYAIMHLLENSKSRPAKYKNQNGDDGDNDDRVKLIRDAHKLEQRAIQKEQQTDRMEDYLEVIYELINKKGYSCSCICLI